MVFFRSLVVILSSVSVTNALQCYLNIGDPESTPFPSDCSSKKDICIKRMKKNTLMQDCFNSEIAAANGLTASGGCEPGGEYFEQGYSDCFICSTDLCNCNDCRPAPVTKEPTRKPTKQPTKKPTPSPTVKASASPSKALSNSPSMYPTTLPSISKIPSITPSSFPTASPSISIFPSNAPSSSHTPTLSKIPSTFPSVSHLPTISVIPTTLPSGSPTSNPSSIPSTLPTASPSVSHLPTISVLPTTFPSERPTSTPSSNPSLFPTTLPSGTHSSNPSSIPTATLTENPSREPSFIPSVTSNPSNAPSVSVSPSNAPSVSFHPTESQRPSVSPGSTPTPSISSSPTTSKRPSSLPSASSNPSVSPSATSSSLPSPFPSANPTPIHTQNPSQELSARPSVGLSARPSVGNTTEPSAPTPLSGGNFNQSINADKPWQKHPWWKYALIPFISGIIGWITNLIALQMLFYPLNFWGIECFRIKDQPWGLFGIQGIIPSKSEKMATICIDLMMNKLFNVKEVFARLDPELFSKSMEEVVLLLLDRVINQVMNKHVHSMWSALPEDVRDEVVLIADKESPLFLKAFMEDMQEYIEDVLDIKHMAVSACVKNKALVNSIFLECGTKEFKFIKNSGFYFGFLFGLFQMTIYLFYSKTWILPVFGFVVGVATNFVALKIIFEPLEEKRIGPFKFQGLFLKKKRQMEVSKTFARVTCVELLHARAMWEAILTGPLHTNFTALLRAHTIVFTDKLVGGLQPLVVTAIGAEKFSLIKEDIASYVVQLLPTIIDHSYEYTTEALDLERTVREKMQALSSVEFEGVLHPAFKEDEILLIICGGILGLIAGVLQLFMF